MKLSSRTRYGMRAILELALEYGKAPLQIKTIAEREDISNKYLEQLIAMLKASGLVRSIRGPRGGYRSRGRQPLRATARRCGYRRYSDRTSPRCRAIRRPAPTGS